MDCIKLLAEMGADLDIPNALGKTLIEIAVEQGRMDCVQYLTDEASTVILYCIFKLYF